MSHLNESIYLTEKVSKRQRLSVDDELEHRNSSKSRTNFPNNNTLYDILQDKPSKLREPQNHIVDILSRPFSANTIVSSYIPNRNDHGSFSRNSLERAFYSSNSSTCSERRSFVSPAGDRRFIVAQTGELRMNITHNDSEGDLFTSTSANSQTLSTSNLLPIFASPRNYTVDELSRAFDRNDSSLITECINSGLYNDFAREKQGINLLTKAARAGRTDVVMCMLNMGVPYNGVDSQGNTAPQLASDYGHLNTTNILRSHALHRHGLSSDSYFDTICPRVIIGINDQTPLPVDVSTSEDIARDVHSLHIEILSKIAPKGSPSLYDVLRKNKLLSMKLEHYNLNVDLVNNIYIQFNSFMAAVKQGKIGTVLSLIQENVNIHACNENHLTPLMVATENCHFDVIRILVNAKADINGMNENRQTALMLAACDNREKAFDTLIELGADIDGLDRFGRNVLMIASSRLSNLANKLVKYTPNLDQTDSDGHTALTHATKLNNIVLVDELLKAKANVNICKYDNCLTPLMEAVRGGLFDIAQHLFNVKLQINPKDPLIFKEKNEIMPYLFTNNFDDEKNSKQRTSLFQQFLKYNANVNAKFPVSNWTALHYAVSIPGKISSCIDLIRAGADPNVGDIHNISPLMYARRFSRYHANYPEEISHILLNHFEDDE